MLRIQEEVKMLWEQAWLNYRQMALPKAEAYFKWIVSDEEEQIVSSAASELARASKAMFNIEGRIIKHGDERADAPCIRLNLVSEVMATDGFRVLESQGRLDIIASSGNGLLYGVYRVLSRIINGEAVAGMNFEETPDNPLRMLNHWDNFDGSIERGYSGNSFFFQDGAILADERIVDYARLAASVGINGVVINNVNVKHEAVAFITEKYLPMIAKLSQIFAGYGIKLFLSLDFAAPMDIGGMASADPKDESVIAWWQERMAIVYKAVPQLGGFLVKADSEGRPGPFTYERTHAEGANVLARAVAPYNGLIIWRCFVYNCQQDWRDLKTDRARAGYDNFMPIDGCFDENVILQIKNGPMDFQVREPISPLLGGLEHTNQMLEVQIAQEYTGQQRHVCYLIPMFKEILAFKTYCKPEADTVADIVSGRTFGQKNCGMAAVANTGNDANWTGHDLAAANLFGFGRLAWNMDLTPEEIAREWAALTYTGAPAVVDAIEGILMSSWPAYESYTSPLGIGWMVNPNHHYGPNVDGYEYDRWGTYHRADHLGIGVDRTAAGTGYATQYREPNAGIFADIEKCPQALLLFFHHIPYTYRLKNGKTIIQHIYDSHFEGVEMTDANKMCWEELKGEIAEPAFSRTLDRLKIQQHHAREWRDVVNAYFYRKTMILDEKGRRIY